MAQFEHELEVARAAALKAGEVALRYREKGIGFETKADASPVTVADRESERLIARALDDAFPDDGLLGEEGAAKPSRSGRRWIIDPIDGTKDYVRGVPVWANLIGLEENGEIVAGVANFAGRSEMYFASRGSGAYCNDRSIRISSVTTVSEASICLTGLNNFGKYAFCGKLFSWISPFWSVRCYGGSMDAMLLARGEVDVWMEASVKPWDLAALKIITEEAGAKFFDFTGASTINGGNCVVSVPALVDEVRRFLGI